MNKLTCLEDLPSPKRLGAGPHNYRRLGARVLITNDGGRYAFLSSSEYRNYLKGIDETSPLWSRLQSGGFLRDACDFDAAGAAAVETGLLGWRGPSSHFLALAREGRAMSLETARQVVDFAFSTPAPRLSLELAADDPEPVWSVVWFIVQYARRKSEWAKRPLELILRTREKLAPERLGFVRAHAVTFRQVMDLRGAPAGSAPTAARVLGYVGESAREPAQWVDWLAEAGADWARFSPAPSLMDERGIRLFLDFYRRALDRMLEMSSARSLRDEWTRSFLGRRAWNLPGTDVLEQLAYDPAGAIFTSEAGLIMDEGGGLFNLGNVDGTRYEELAQSDAVKACVASCQADNQPLCSQCVYKPYCTLPPAANFRYQGTIWGQTPSSPLCALHMGILDLIFERIESGRIPPITE